MLIVCLYILLLIPVGCNKLHRSSRIALATEGRASEVSEWFKMMKKMELKSHVSLFMLSYDIPINETICNGHAHVVCLHAPGSTWTSGRNIMTRSIANYETDNKHPFKYWLFGDHDMVKLDNCGEATKCQAPQYPAHSTELAACCFDVGVETLIAPEVQWAVVNFNIWGGGRVIDWLSFSHIDCCDGSLNAFHRLAVPTILPYIELVDKKSWWEAQGLHFHLVSGCFPGYSVYSNVFSIKATSAHSPYPMGRYPDPVNRAVRQVYGKYDLVPNPISLRTVQLEQGNCANVNHSTLPLDEMFEHRLPANSKLKTVWDTAAWQNSTSFRRCLAHLTPRFLSYLESGDLVKTDGAVYS
jgi:hypothetical protein